MNGEFENDYPDVENNEDVVDRLMFGVDSHIPANRILQNNLSLFEWVVRNKEYPVFWIRNIVGDDALTAEEIDFLHNAACKIAPLYTDDHVKDFETSGQIIAERAIACASNLGIPEGTAIFLNISDSEVVTTAFLKGYASGIINKGYVPGFKANTDSKYIFDCEFSRGIQVFGELFKNCLIWATAPGITEYNRITTTHFIHPDNWRPYTPSGIRRKDIAMWQYGKNCHEICDDDDNEVFFNVDLIRNINIIKNKMF